MICDLSLTNKNGIIKYYCPHLTDEITKAQTGQWIAWGIKLGFKDRVF